MVSQELMNFWNSIFKRHCDILFRYFRCGTCSTIAPIKMNNMSTGIITTYGNHIYISRSRYLDRNKGFGQLLDKKATLRKILLPMVALAAAHEIPQELVDFSVLIHGGFGRVEALLFNARSALTFLLGGILTYFAATAVDVTFLVPFAAGTFIYIGASDLVPEVNKHENTLNNVIHFLSSAAGIALMWLITSTLGSTSI